MAASIIHHSLYILYSVSIIDRESSSSTANDSALISISERAPPVNVPCSLLSKRVSNIGFIHPIQSIFRLVSNFNVNKKAIKLYRFNCAEPFGNTAEQRSLCFFWLIPCKLRPLFRLLLLFTKFKF